MDRSRCRRRTAVRAVTLLLAVLGAGAWRSAAAPADAPNVPSACTAAPAPGDTAIALTSSGLARTALLHLPPNIPGGRALPLVVAYHGYGGSGPAFERDTGLSAEADRDGFAVVYPTALGAEWAISGRERDVILTSDVLDRVESVACVDQHRVYATGVSIGAGMAARAGCELSDRIAALVLVAGGYRSLPACAPDRPVSVLEVHGTADATVPYHGEGPTHAGAVLPFVSAWAARDRCGPTPVKTVAAPHTLLYRWSGCAWGETVEHLAIYGGRHGLPQAPGAEISAGAGSPVSGVRVIWHFLASRTLAHPFAPPADAAARTG